MVEKWVFTQALAGARRWRWPFRCGERKAPWGHAPLRSSRRESAVAQLFSLGVIRVHGFLPDNLECDTRR